MQTDLVKRCSKCKQMKTLDEFACCKSGHQSYCRPCQAQYFKAWRGKSPDTDDPPQHLYILTFEDDSLSQLYGCKIGRSKDPEQRALQLTQSLPMDVRLVCTFPNQGAVEPLVHQRLAAYKITASRSKEWFRLGSYEAVQKVAAILEEAAPWPEFP